MCTPQSHSVHNTTKVTVGRKLAIAVAAVVAVAVAVAVVVVVVVFLQSCGHKPNSTINRYA